MRKIGYILAAVYAVFSLSVTSLAAGLMEEAESVADTVESAAEDILGGDDTSDSDTQDDPAEADTSDTEDEPIGAGTSDSEPEISSSEDTTTGPSDAGIGGAAGGNPGTGVVLGFTALGMAAAGLTAAAARKRK